MFAPSRARLGCLALSLALGCGDDDEHSDAATDLRKCQPGPEASGSPTSIEQAIALMNSLPAPVDVACLVESLDRPLYLEATASTLSAQPAGGEPDPRLFVFFGPLVLSVVPDGRARDLVEFAEISGFRQSVKAELELPLPTPISPAAPFARVESEAGGTTCGGCHGGERPSSRIDGAFESNMFRPADDTLVPIERLLDEAMLCDPQAQPERCRFFDALVTPGELVHQPFPDELPTFFH